MCGLCLACRPFSLFLFFVSSPTSIFLPLDFSSEKVESGEWALHLHLLT